MRSAPAKGGKVDSTRIVVNQAVLARSQATGGRSRVGGLGAGNVVAAGRVRQDDVEIDFDVVGRRAASASGEVCGATPAQVPTSADASASASSQVDGVDGVVRAPSVQSETVRLTTTVRTQPVWWPNSQQQRRAEHTGNAAQCRAGQGKGRTGQDGRTGQGRQG